MTVDVIHQLRNVVQSSGVSQADIAKETGIDPGVLSRFVRGERGITDATFAKLCQFFNLELRPARQKR
jgi:transcriptional regulator with XRE-family HTH domain